jgi:CPA2 family monovalent cation:H+ antiporter-2
VNIDAHHLKVVLILTLGFALASSLGYLTQRIKLSPILGYLAAGYIIGPYSPGFVADIHVSEQLAEIGVILMMCGVGMHFKLQDLLNVKKIAIPGAIFQTLFSTLLGTIFIYSLGWSIISGVVIGLAIGVASTVVLMRILTENHLIHTPEGNISVGWLIIEDLLTVVALIFLPTFASYAKGGDPSLQSVAISLALMVIKFSVFALIMFTIGKKVFSYILIKIVETRSHELFTITILALAFGVATGSALIFGTSIPLGAFVAGMTIGQTYVKHQANAHFLPMKDAFAMIFFASVGMLFNPSAINNHFLLFMGILLIILIGKPFAAFLISFLFKHPIKTSLTIAIALAQIGEFSFILTEEATKWNIIPDEGYDVIVACAIITIALNPLFFKIFGILKTHLPFSPLTRQKELVEKIENSFKALVVGFDQLGQNVAKILEENGYLPMVLDRSLEKIEKLTHEGKTAFYGEATISKILESAHIKLARLLIITISDTGMAVEITKKAKELNPNLVVLTRIRQESEKASFKNLEVAYVCDEEETKDAFRQAILNLIEEG